MLYQKYIESSINFSKKSRNLHISTKISIFNLIKKTAKKTEKNGLNRRSFRPVGWYEKGKKRLIAISLPYIYNGLFFGNANKLQERPLHTQRGFPLPTT